MKGFRASPFNMNPPIRILGIDPGLRRTGWGVIVMRGNALSFVAAGTVKAPLDGEHRGAVDERALGAEREVRAVALPESPTLDEAVDARPQHQCLRAGAQQQVEEGDGPVRRAFLIALLEKLERRLDLDLLRQVTFD